MSARRGLLGVVVAAVTCAVVPSAPAAARTDIGVQDDPVFVFQSYGPPGGRDAAFADARALGGRWLRINIIWSDYVRRGFAPYDGAVNAARARGFATQITISGTPSYDSRGDQRLSWKRASQSRFAAFARTVAQHFRGRVFRYSLWNEPNLDLFLSPQRSAPSMYKSLYSAGYAALKRTDPRAKVLFGELFSGNVHAPSGRGPLAFLNAMSGRLRADGLAYHPFQYADGPRQRSRRYVALASMSSIKSTLRALSRRRVLRTWSGGTLPIYFTEFGYQITGSYRIRSESRRASWTVEAFRMAKRGGAKSMLYYHLVRNYGGRWDGGILNAGGFRTPVFNALVGARRSLIGR